MAALSAFLFAPLFPPAHAPSWAPRHEDASPAPAMPFVAVFIDPDAPSLHAAWRGALVARDHALPLRLVACHGRLPAREAARPSLDGLASDIGQRLRLSVSCTEAGPSPDGIDRLAAHAALVVLPAATPRPLVDHLFGSRAEQWLRRIGRPVLVVRRPALASYRRALVCVDLAPGSRELVQAGRQLARDPRPTVLHALCTRHEEILHLADVPAARIRESYERTAARARAAIERLVAATGAAPHDVQTLIERGPVAERIVRRSGTLDADLLVLGPRRPGRWSGWGRGVTRRVLAQARSDVLLMPLRPEDAR